MLDLERKFRHLGYRPRQMNSFETSIQEAMSAEPPDVLAAYVAADAWCDMVVRENYLDLEKSLNLKFEVSKIVVACAKARYSPGYYGDMIRVLFVELKLQHC